MYDKIGWYKARYRKVYSDGRVVLDIYLGFDIWLYNQTIKLSKISKKIPIKAVRAKIKNAELFIQILEDEHIGDLWYEEHSEYINLNLGIITKDIS